jgi:hypothetical protein
MFLYWREKLVMVTRVHCLRRTRKPLLAAIGGATLIAAGPAIAQSQQPSYSIDLSAPVQARPTVDTDPQQKVGSVATSSVGAAGQRREQNQGIANIKPTARVENRIANRVQSRIRNRIDRNYDPQANATSPFKVAADQEDPM